MITNTHTTAVVYKAADMNKTLVVPLLPLKLLRVSYKHCSQRVRPGSNHEGSCHCSSAPYHACKSELCTLGIGETSGFVVIVSLSFDGQVH